MSGNDIQQVITMIDQESANSIYRRCAEEFDFKIVEVEGKVLSVAKELSFVFGYSSANEVLRVLNRNLIETVMVGRLRQADVIDVKTKFDLAKNDNKQSLIDYHGFLTIALEGHGSVCDKVREYLLAMEKKARVDSVVYETTGMDADDFQEIGQYMDDPMIQNILERRKQMKDIIQLRMQQLEIQRHLAETQQRIGVVETTLEEKVSVTPKQEEILLKRRDELISFQVQNGRDRRKAYVVFTRNIKERFHFGLFCGLERSKFDAVINWIDGLIEQERQKLAQLDMFRPKVVSMR